MAILEILFLSIFVCLIFAQEIVSDFLVFLRNLESQEGISIGPDVGRGSTSIATVACMPNTAVTPGHRYLLNPLILILKPPEENSQIIRASHTEQAGVGRKYHNQIFPTHIGILLQPIDLNILNIGCRWDLNN